MRNRRVPFNEFVLPVARVTPPRYDSQRVDLGGVIARRGERPWLLELLEPISDRAPNPSICGPWTCYLNTVIFYARPYRLRGGRPVELAGSFEWSAGGGGYVEFDNVETRLSWDDVIACDGDRWMVGAGQVVWQRRRWWMHRECRRVQP